MLEMDDVFDLFSMLEEFSSSSWFTKYVHEKSKPLNQNYENNFHNKKREFFAAAVWITNIMRILAVISIYKYLSILMHDLTTKLNKAFTLDFLCIHTHHVNFQNNEFTLNREIDELWAIILILLMLPMDELIDQNNICSKRKLNWN